MCFAKSSSYCFITLLIALSSLFVNGCAYETLQQGALSPELQQRMYVAVEVTVEEWERVKGSVRAGTKGLLHAIPVDFTLDICSTIEKDKDGGRRLGDGKTCDNDHLLGAFSSSRGIRLNLELQDGEYLVNYVYPHELLHALGAIEEGKPDSYHEDRERWDVIVLRAKKRMGEYKDEER